MLRENLRIDRISFKGKSLLFKRGATALRDLVERGVGKAIVCVDADGPTEDEVRARIEREIIAASGVQIPAVAIVPVQEVEAWILADIICVTKIFTSWQPREIQNPESIPSPKEHLERLSRDHRARPRFDSKVHNERLARFLDLDVVGRRCPSFRRLIAFVRKD
jgi:hypothetical protein